MATLVEGLGKLGTTFWEYGRAFLWGCAGAALLVFAVCMGRNILAFLMPVMSSRLSVFGS